MTAFIAEYWMQGLFTIIVAVCTLSIKKMSKNFGNFQDQQKAMKDGILSLGHDRIYQAFRFYAKRYNETGKGLTLEERENMEYLFDGYSELGGNGTGKDLYEKCMALPVETGSED